jgi:histidinol-phosphate aminotransferase
MSRLIDLVSKPAREMGTANTAPTPAAMERGVRLIKLDSNENPFGPSPLAVDALRKAIATANFYPDDDCSQLRWKLGTRHGLPPEQVLVGAGSTELISLLCQTLLAPGLNAVTSERSFIIYSMAVRAVGGQLIEAAMRDDSFDLETILAAINANTRMVFLANPNNPTGTVLEAAAVERFLARIPDHVVVVIDEAYYEFAMHFAALRKITHSNSLEYVRKGASVVVLRTFSKAHGLAGLRVGYVLGQAELLGYCARMRNTFSVSSVGQAAAMAALDDDSHIQRAVENNAAQSRILAEGLSALGYRVVPTSSIWVKMARRSLVACWRKVWPCGQWGLGERRIAFA